MNKRRAGRASASSPPAAAQAMSAISSNCGSMFVQMPCALPPAQAREQIDQSDRLAGAANHGRLTWTAEGPDGDVDLARNVATTRRERAVARGGPVGHRTPCMRCGPVEADRGEGPRTGARQRPAQASVPPPRLAWSLGMTGRGAAIGWPASLPPGRSKSRGAGSHAGARPGRRSRRSASS